MVTALVLIISVGGFGYVTGSELRNLDGPFAVCSEGHFFHGPCYSGWGKSCPTCRISKEEIVEVCGVRLDPSGECAICTDRFDAHVDQKVIVDVAIVEKKVEADFVPTQEANGLIKCYLDICGTKKRSMSPRRVVSAFRDWEKHDRALRVALRDNYLKEASNNSVKEALIRSAKDNPEDRDLLKTEMEKRRSGALEATAATNYPGLINYIGERLTKEIIIDLLDDRIY